VDLDPVMLARLQFAFTVSFHIIFPSFTIGLAAYIATLLVMWLRTGVERYQLLARFWTKIFAVSFGMGVVSGIVLSYQFGTNWSRFSLVVGNAIGPLIGYEVLTAFFLEATFLGVLLFGWSRVPPWLVTLSAVIVDYVWRTYVVQFETLLMAAIAIDAAGAIAILVLYLAFRGRFQSQG